MFYMKVYRGDEKILISLPSKPEPIIIGPGTVPLSGTSVSTVSMEELRKSAREVSKLGIFDTESQNQYPA